MATKHVHEHGKQDVQYFFMLHVHVNAACTCPCLYCMSLCPCCRSKPMLAVLVWTCSMYMDTQHVLGHAAWTWSCRMDMDMQHGMDINMDKQHVLFHAACQCPCCMYLLGNAALALTSTCSMDIDIQRDIDMQHR
jgi:hypothetical protein